MNTQTLVQIAGLLLFGTSAANANLIDFESLAPGTIVTNQFAADGAVFRPLPSGFSLPAPLGVVADTLNVPPRIDPFGNSLRNAMFLGTVGDVVYLDFVSALGAAAAVPTVSFRLGNGNPFFETEFVNFFGPNGFIAGIAVTTQGPDFQNGRTVSFTAPDGICQVQFTGGATFGAGMALDDVSFDTPSAPCRTVTDPTLVAEPGTLPLVVGALLLCACRRRPASDFYLRLT